MAEVLTHERFTSPDRAKELEEAGIIVLSDVDKRFEELDAIGEPEYGETIIDGALATKEEKAYLIALAEIETEMAEAERRIQADLLRLVADRFDAADVSERNWREMVADMGDDELPDNIGENITKLLRATRIAGMLHNTLYFGIAERLDLHAYGIGIRTKGRIVKMERKF